MQCLRRSQELEWWYDKQRVGGSVHSPCRTFAQVCRAYRLPPSNLRSWGGTSSQCGRRICWWPKCLAAWLPAGWLDLLLNQDTIMMIRISGSSENGRKQGKWPGGSPFWLVECWVCLQEKKPSCLWIGDHLDWIVHLIIVRITYHSFQKRKHYPMQLMLPSLLHQ